MAKGKGQSRKRPAVEKKFDGGGSRVNAVNTWDDMEHDSEDDCKSLFMSAMRCLALEDKVAHGTTELTHMS